MNLRNATYLDFAVDLEQSQRSDPHAQRIDAELKEFFPHEVKAIEQAVGQARSERRTLSYDAQYNPPEVNQARAARQREQALARLQPVIDRVVQAVARARIEAEDGIARLEADPFGRLSASEQREALARKPFVDEDAQLPVHRLLPLAQAAAAGDTPEAYLWWRALTRRVDAEREAGARPNDELVAVVRRLGQRFADPEALEKRRKLERKPETSKTLLGRLQSAQAEVDGTAERRFETLRGEALRSVW